MKETQRKATTNHTLRIIPYNSMVWQALGRLVYSETKCEKQATEQMRFLYIKNCMAMENKFRNCDERCIFRAAVREQKMVVFRKDLIQEIETNGCPQIIADCYRIDEWIYQFHGAARKSNRFYEPIKLKNMELKQEAAQKILQFYPRKRCPKSVAGFQKLIDFYFDQEENKMIRDQIYLNDYFDENTTLIVTEK